jgi:hypothetical protein
MARLRFLFLFAGFSVIACAEDPVTPGPKGDGGVPTFEGIDASPPVDAGAEAGPAPINGCTTFVDRTDVVAPRSLQWDLSVGSLAHRCMRIKVGQKVTFVAGAAPADFGAHPLTVYEPSPTGRNPGPVVDAPTGEVTFTTAGAFGFVCDAHSQMNGAVDVVP